MKPIAIPCEAKDLETKLDEIFRKDGRVEAWDVGKPNNSSYVLHVVFPDQQPELMENQPCPP